MSIVGKLPEKEVEKCMKNLERNLSLANKMSQVRIANGISDELYGKTIEKTSLYNSYEGNCDENHLVIKFTDGTYILITIENDEGVYFGQHMPKAEHFSPNSLGYIANDSFNYYKCYQQLIDIGVLNHIPEETLKAKILEHKRKQELYEYERYKQLREKYKDYNPTENNQIL